MRRRAAAGVAAPVLALVVLLSACQGGRPDAVVAGDDLPDCSDDACASQVAAYGEAVSQLPGVQTVRDLDYEPEQITDSAGVSGELVVSDASDCALLEDDLGRLLWESSISPVVSVTLLCFGPGASGSDYEYAAYSLSLEDEAELAERWGPRGG